MSSRLLPLLALPLALAVGCSSNNKGKIEGTKWTSAAGMVTGNMLPAGAMQLEFTTDGKLLFRVGPMQYTGRYSLGWGDNSMFYFDQPIDGNTKTQQRLIINGDSLTVTDPDGTTLSFTRVQPETAPGPTAVAAPSPLGDMFGGLVPPGQLPPPPGQTPATPAAGAASPVVMPSGPPLPGTVNLLEQIKPARDQIRGNWRIEGGNLVVPTDPSATLSIPFAVPPEYRITAVVERTFGAESFNIGLVMGGRQTMVVFDGWGGNVAALSMIDNRTGDDNETTHRAKTLHLGRPSTIVCDVRRNRIEVLCDGSRIIQWSGDPQRFSLDNRFWTNIPPQRLFLGAWNAGFRVSKLDFSPL